MQTITLDKQWLLTGKIAIVAGGIGRDMVLTLPRQGAKVPFGCVSPSSKAHAEALVCEIESLGSSAHAIEADAACLSFPAAATSSSLTAFNISHLNILANNAGLGSAGTRIEEITGDEFDKIRAVNVHAVIFMIQEFIPYAHRGGRIVNLPSISARGGYATQSVYSASKAAFEALTRIWATELRQKYNITVNAVSLGPVGTDMHRAAGEVQPARMEEQNMNTPAAPRLGTEDNVAELVVFLCEERSSWITGDVVCANGGRLYT
ncbi:short chain oxidoreductase [Fusarium pseudoanthophilum]|uniref:Short chain oxidoreductase n=1 Tax=Fusarium pseudoanthophilum TaxID=48495 RepID=A0A8H5L7V1_9HYPO|nr:short chain oxidoreductase [Fusarium pseudoanthophilum]